MTASTVAKAVRKFLKRASDPENTQEQKDFALDAGVDLIAFRRKLRKKMPFKKKDQAISRREASAKAK